MKHIEQYSAQFASLDWFKAVVELIYRTSPSFNEMNQRFEFVQTCLNEFVEHS